MFLRSGEAKPDMVLTVGYLFGAYYVVLMVR